MINDYFESRVTYVILNKYKYKYISWERAVVSLATPSEWLEIEKKIINQFNSPTKTNKGSKISIITKNIGESVKSFELNET